MKVLLHQQAARALPRAELIVTGNATINRWMNAVNDELGYRPVDRSSSCRRCWSTRTPQSVGGP